MNFFTWLFRCRHKYRIAAFDYGEVVIKCADCKQVTWRDSAVDVAWREGRAAFKEGRTADANPYILGNSRHNAFARGFIESRDSSIHELSIPVTATMRTLKPSEYLQHYERGTFKDMPEAFRNADTVIISGIWLRMPATIKDGRA